jgi:hypothetical protein
MRPAGEQVEQHADRRDPARSLHLGAVALFHDACLHPGAVHRCVGQSHQPTSRLPPAIGGTSCRSARDDLWRGQSRFRPQLSAELIHWFGAEGQATITGSFDTGISYNDRRVMGHNVLIKTADARTIETSFDYDDFNVYPPKNGVYYPQEGDAFNVS